MRCNICGNEFDGNSGACPNCDANSRVQVLSPDERENFNGITIEQGNGDEQAYRGKSPFAKTFIFKSTSAGPLTKLILSALVLIAIVVFLPLVLLFAATFGLNWLAGRGGRQ